ncbi:MAG TPA: hypothetical protein VGZ00_07745 [Candidatus Baltobacteraceae bacterium]|jgi:hypothetical protein|nr:hypothetical protein [Candidatus Baltobacteraceae bacterium]
MSERCGMVLDVPSYCEGIAFLETTELKSDATNFFKKFERPTLNRLESQIQETETLLDDWDSYGAPPPNQEALRWARESVPLADSERFLPHNIAASAEGGIALCWDDKDVHAYIEFSNDGSAVSVMYRGMEDPYVREFSPEQTTITGMLGEVRVFFSNES